MKFLSNILAKAGLIVDGTATLNSVANATTDTDRFIVIDNGVVKYRTGAELRSDIDAAIAAAAVPVGGSAGQILAKVDGTNYNTEWIDNFTTDIRQNVKAGESINKGQAVYISGADGTNVVVSKASNTSDATSSKTLGLLSQNLSNNGQGFVITEGKLTGINTSTAQAGDPVWLGTNGNLLFGLANKPVAPAHLVYLGVVTRANQNNGEIFVHVVNGFELEELHDVLIGTYGSKDVLWRDTATNLWKNRDIFNLIGAASGSANGYLTSTDWTTFNNKQNALSLTTSCSSGAATLVGSTLNVPQYTLSGLGGVPTSRQLTINGTAFDLSADRSWTVGDVRTDSTYSNPAWITALTWSKITNTPTTLNGYGITDGVRSVGLTTSTTGVTIGSTPVTGSGNITIDIATASGSTIGLLSSSDWTTFNNKQNALTLTTSGSSGAATLVGATLNVPQYQAAGNYITALTGEVTASGPGSASATLTNSAVIGKVLTGLNLTGGGTIASTDSILQAFGKIQNQISAMVGGVMFQGTWNANTNTPTLASGTGTKGHYYIVDVSGTTTLDGKSDWRVGDWAIFNGTAWDKVDNTDAVSSVNGFTGAVSLSTSHINEGTNLYYTDARARAAITLTTTGNSGSATYSGGTLNVPTYTLAGLGGVASTRTLTINGTAFDLSADRSWSVGTVTSVGLSSATSGVTIGNTPVTGSGTITIAIATASGSQNGLLSSTDWTTFNNKQNALTNPVTGTGTSGTIAKFTGTSTIGNSLLSDDGSRLVTLDGSAANNGVSLVINTASQNASTVIFTVANVRHFDTGFDANTNYRIGAYNNGTYLGNALAIPKNTMRILINGAVDDTANALQISGNARLTALAGTGQAFITANSDGQLVRGNNLSSISLTVSDLTVGALGSGIVVVTNGTLQHQTGTANRFLRWTNSTVVVDSSLRENGSGNLGLGVDPSAWVSGSQAFENSTYASSVYGYTRNAYFNGTSWIYVSNSFASRYAQFESQHLWYTAPSGTAGNAISFTQAMTLGSNSGLSVGTTSTAPANGILSAATIQSNDQNAFWLNQAGNTTDTKLWAIQNLVTSGTFRVRALNDSATNGINAIEISRSGISSVTTAFMGGNVGIGTATPNSTSGYSTLSVNGTSGGQITWQTGGSLIGYAYNTSNGLVVGGDTGKALFFDAGGSPRMTITSGGNVGIGTASPIAGLDVRIAPSNVSAYFLNAGADFKIVNASGLTSIGTSVANTLAFLTSDTVQMRLTSSGNLGLGVTPSAWGSIFVATQIGVSGSFLLGRTDAISQTQLGSNAFFDGSNWKYFMSGSHTAARYFQNGGEHVFENAIAGTGGNNITWNTRMLIKSGGQVRFVPLAADPGSAESGDVYYNSGTNKLRVYNGTSWVDLH